MRCVFVGAGSLTVATAKLLIERGYQVIIVEVNKERINELSDTLDCSFLQGDGSKPEVLKEIGPEDCDILFSLSNDDQDNLVAALAGRSLGFKRVIPRISDPQFEIICQELKLDDYIVPNRTIACHLADLASGTGVLDLSSSIKGDARLFSWIFDGSKDIDTIEDLKLPQKSKVICIYRDETLQFVDDKTQLKENDEIVVICHYDVLQKLQNTRRKKQ